VEVLAVQIADNIANKLGYSNEKKEVIAYGLKAIFQMGSILLLSSIIGLLLGVCVEALVTYFSIGLLRKSTGGAHSHTAYGCLIISVVVVSVLSLLSKYVIAYYFSNIIFLSIVTLFFIIFSIFYVFKKVPVDSPNKPIVKEEKIKRLRRNSYITIFIYFFFVLFLSFFLKGSIGYSISASIIFSTFWQLYTLSKSGHRLIDIIDSKFR
jgi:accessory gene regulator B